MIKMTRSPFAVELSIPEKYLKRALQLFHRYILWILTVILSGMSVYYFSAYLRNGLGLQYNDARSHLDIGRRVVEGLKPGIAQLGSVWLPLNHVLMMPTIWNDWAWHTGFAGAIQSMISFVATALIIYAFLRELKVGMIGRITGVAVFVANINILYLQSTAMTELLLLATMTIGSYYLLMWHKTDEILHLIKAAFWIMLATLVRYDGWLLLGFAGLLVMSQTLRSHGWKRIEGVTILFATLATFGVTLWFLWNQLIFKDALYFMLGPFSAHSQQLTMERAGALPTKHNLLLSLKVYFYALLFNTYTIPSLFAIIGYVVMLRDKTLKLGTRISTIAMWSPFFFNVLALYLGFSVIYVQGISGDTWFNIRYGIMILPAVAICIGFLVDRAKAFRPLLIGLLAFVLFFALVNSDAVTLDDARVGSSQKNVSEVSGYLNIHARNEKGFILISVASHDAIIFSSGLPMKRFIHEGTGSYWLSATSNPDRWARWIVMRTYDDQDLTWKAVSKTPGFLYYHKVAAYPFADVYELDPSRLPGLITEPVFGKQK
jgi:hypothetical protein